MEIRKLTSDEFYLLFKDLRDHYFNETLWFSSHDVRTPHEVFNKENLTRGFANRWELHLGLYQDNVLIGWCSSYQTKAYELYMMNSVVFPEYRRRGHYTRLVQATIVEAKLAGFQVVTSNHVCTNNAVIIPKLKLDFKITGFEMSDEFGVIVKLTHFLNPTRSKAIEFRSGCQKPDAELKELFKI